MKLLSSIILLAGLGLAACSPEQTASAPETPGSEAVEPAGAPSPSPADDPITALCVDMSSLYSDAQCACGTKAFRASAEDVDVYERMAAYYLEETNPEQSLVERWDEVVDVVLADTQGSKLQLSNRLGKAHRDAIKSCAE